VAVLGHDAGVERVRGQRGTSVRLSGVSCTWATAGITVGSYVNGAGQQVTLAERWNGTSWTIQPTRNPGGGPERSLNGVSCTSAMACTAAGIR